MVNRIVSFGVLVVFVFGISLLFLSDYGIFTGRVISSGDNILVNFPERISVGEEKIFDFSASVINFGDKSLDNCKFVFTGDKGSFISSEGVEDLGPSEKQIYIIHADTKGISEGVYSVNYRLSCNQGSVTGRSYLDVSSRDFGFDVERIEISGDKILAYYTLNQFKNSEQNILISYELKDVFGKKISNGRDEVVLGEIGNYEGVLSLDSISKDDLNIVVKADNGKDSIYVSKEIGSSSGAVTGFSVYEGNGKSNPIFIIIFSIALLLATLVFLRKREVKGAIPQREFIKLNLHHNGNL